MKKDDSIFVGHMLDTARTIASKGDGLDRAAFDADENLRFAVAYLIQIIGEAASRVSEEFRSAHGQIPWRSIIGMRHKIVHDYLYVNYDIVWQVVSSDVHALIEQLAPLVDQ